MSEPDPLRNWRLVGFVATIAIALSVPLYLTVRAVRAPGPRGSSTALYIGSDKCGSCHKPEYERWKTSNHALAMQPARPGTVKGDFSGVTVTAGGMTATFETRGEAFIIRTDGPDGKPRDYEVAYTFGVRPLQQYLVPFPGGRLQAFSLAWDTEKKRWFFLYPDRTIPASDWLHWTRPGQNWNTMCAYCHSTAVRKRYDPETDQFQTTWSEIAVGCEACHGPGSRHATWAEQPPMARQPVKHADLVVPGKQLPPRDLIAQCAPCHARRAQFADTHQPGGDLLDTMLPTLLDEGTYYADGQILDEDFEYNSFIQSKMYEKGVACNDCHDVHGARRLKETNELCTRCHRADTYDTPNHHFHKPTVSGKPSPAAQCQSCHMDGRYFMVVHYRRDHSLRIPRPDLTESIGTPNACSTSGCHADRPLRWVIGKYDGWYGRTRKPHYGTVIAAGRAGRPDAAPGLIELSRDPLRPGIARATALSLLGGYPGPEVRAAFEQAMGDQDALVRWAAAEHFPTSEVPAFLRALGRALKDPARGVRSAAAARLAPAVGSLTAAQQDSYTAALNEYVDAQTFMSDMPSGPYNLGNLHMAQGQPAAAEPLLRRALAIDDQFFPAQVNLALTLASLNRNDEAEALLRRADRARPGQPAVLFNLGLLLAGGGKVTEAEATLRAALKADPSLAAAAYNLAVLVATRSPAEAIDLARRAAAAAPDVPRYGFALAYFQQQAGDIRGAIATLEDVLRRWPNDADAQALLARLRGAR